MAERRSAPAATGRAKVKHDSIVQVAALGERGGHWVAIHDRYRRGPEALSYPAQAVLATVLTYRSGHVPTTQGIYEAQKRNMEELGHRWYGIDRIKQALAELKERGFYAVRRVSGGRGKIVQLRSFANKPFEHIKILDALPREQVLRKHFPDLDADVVNLNERRLSRAG